MIKEKRLDLVELLNNIGLRSDFYWSDEDFSEDSAKKELAKGILEIKKNYFKSLIDQCYKKMVLAEKDNNTKAITEIMEDLKKYNEELKKII